MTTLDKLEWALMTIEDQLQFGLPEDQAAKARERRVKGVLLDAVKEIKRLEGEISGLVYCHTLQSDNKSFALKDFPAITEIVKDKDWFKAK